MKYLLLMIVLSYSSSLLACKYEERPRMFPPIEMEKYPQNVKYIFTSLVTLDEVKKNNYNRKLVVEKKWSEFSEKSFSVMNSDCPDYQYDIGSRVLVLSYNMKENLEILTFPLSESESQIDKLSSKKNFVGELNPSWKYCKEDSECKTVKDKCAHEISINKKHETTYLNFINSTKRIFNCSKLKSPPKNKCINNFCE